MTDPMTGVWAAAAVAMLLLGGLALRMIFAPEAKQEKHASARLRQLGGQERQQNAAALVRAQDYNVHGRVWPVVGNIGQLVERGGFAGQGHMVLAGIIGAGLVLGTALMLVMPGFLAFPVGGIVAAAAAVKYLRVRHNRRMAAMVAQMPDALDLMMRGLRVGHPVGATIGNVARTMPDPIGAEFRQLSDQITHGDYLADAFRDFAQRTGQEDVAYLSVAISIQHGTGGNLGEMLGTLSGVIRDRIVMRRKIKALSSEGRLSAWLLSSLPVVIFAATSISSPQYYSGVADDPLFKPLMAATVVLVVVNFLALRKLVDFKI